MPLPKLKNTLFHLITILIGASLTGAFAPFNIWPLAIICPALLLLLLQNTSAKKAFLTSALFGFGFFSTGVSWVYVSLHDYGQANAALALLLTFLMILVLLSYTALAGYLLNRYFPHQNLTRYLLAFPSLWVLSEWCRELVFTGFPWLLLGYSQLNTPLSGLAPLASVFGVSWAVAATAGGLVFCCSRIAIKSGGLRLKSTFNPCDIFYALIFITFLWSASFVLKKITWTQPDGAPLSVTLVQGNIAQTLKWTPDQIEKTLAIYEQLTQPHWKNQLIIWPEAAITVLQAQAKDYLQRINHIAVTHHSTLITGIPITENNQTYNGMIALGNGTGAYKKRHLVPFGEFIPLRFLLDWLDNYVQIPMSDFSRGERYQPLIQANHIPIAAFICYEIAYPDEVLDALPEGKLLIVISDDSWFGKSIAATQHLQIAQMRALEMGRYLLAGTNDGITAIINPQGKISAIAPSSTATVLSGNIQPMSGSTPLIRIGIYPVMGLMFLLLGIAWRRESVKKHL